VFRNAAELFDDSWQQVMLGQGLMPERYHALVDTMTTKELTEFLQHIKSNVDRTVLGLPEHSTYLASFLQPS
jgi:tryptophan halogenase